MRKITLALLAMGLCGLPGYAQMHKWLLQNTIVDMKSHPSYPSTTLSPAPTTTVPLTDAVFDENGSLLFYIAGKGVYNSAGTQAFSLPNYWDPTGNCMESMDAFKRRETLNKGLVIVPVPKACKKYYIIYSLMPGAMGSNSLVYVTVDVSSGAPVLGATVNQYFPMCGTKVNATLLSDYAYSCNSVQMVASKVFNTSSGNRYLFSTGARECLRFEITATGIVNKTVIANASTPGGIFANDADFYAGDMELSPDQNHLAWSPYAASGNKTVYMINLNNYGFSSAKKFSNSLATGGIEFDASSDNIYITNSNGIQSVSVGAASGSTFSTVFSGSQYATSNLELGYSGLLYVANSSTNQLEYKDLATPANSGATGIAMSSTSSFACTEYHLPNQISGEDYSYFSGASHDLDNLISRDDNLDIGAEQNVQSADIWESPDIFNCRTNQGNCSSHQNPGYLSPTTGNNYMRVRVKNIGCYTSRPAVVHMYWTLGSTGETWPDSWTGTGTNGTLCGIAAGGELSDPSSMIQGVAVPALLPRQETIVTLPWDPVDPDDYGCQSLSTYKDGNPMICLLGRIVSPYDPMYSELPGRISHNVGYNNNIVTRNTSLVPLAGSKPGRDNGTRTSILTHNYLEQEATMEIRFNGLNGGTTPFNTLGNIILTMDEDLWTSWYANGHHSEGVEIVNADHHEIMIGNLSTAVLTDIPVAPGKYGGLTFEFFLNNETDVADNYVFSVSQRLRINEDLVYDGSECHFLVSVNGKDNSEEGGGAGTDPVFGQPISKKINLNNNAGFDLYPNPAKEATQLAFTLKNKGKVTLTLLDMNGRVIECLAKEKSYTEGRHEFTIHTSGLSNGMYLLRFESQEESTTIKMSVAR